MKFLRKIKNAIFANKAVIVLSLLTAFLLGFFIFQFVEYSTLNSAANNARATKIGQRVIVDLQDKKWFSDNLISDVSDSEIVVTGEVKFSGIPNSAEPDFVEDIFAEKIVENEGADKEGAETAETKTDDAFSRGLAEEKEEAAKPNEKPNAKPNEKANEKPVIKVLDTPVVNESLPEISIIIANLGLNDNAIKSASLLGDEFAYAFTPYGQVTTKSSIQLAEEGHAVLAQLPMESTKTREDGGRFSMSPAFDEKKNKQNFEAIYSIIPSAVGFVTPPEEDFSGTGDSLDKILRLILDKNAAVIYLGKSPKQVREFAAINGLEAIIPNLTIDSQPSAADIKAQLKALETIAKENGSAVGYARPYPITFEVLAEWAKTLPEKKLKLTSAVEK